jgi:DMSO/TMAO reductase YedYZ heme-binding membrane subunit
LTVGGLAVGIATGGTESLQISLTLAYLALGGLLTTLAIGPLQRLTRQRPPINVYWRRDLGVWSALASVAHVIVALGPASVLPVARYFTRAGRDPVRHVRTDQFGLANLSGLVALVLAIGLVTISNDRSLRRLGRRWKSYQRANYVIGAAASVHAMCLWSLLHRHGPVVTVSLVAMTALILLRIAGGIAPRRDHEPSVTQSQSNTGRASRGG